MKPYYEEDGITIYCGDCRDVIPTLGKVEAIVTDPPYMGVISDSWDNQWANDEDFLAYISSLVSDFSKLLADNGSLYCFASPRMAARVEVEIRKHLHVLNNLVWSKGASRQGAAGSGIDVTSLRRFWSSGDERVIFAESRGSDGAYQGALVDENSTYWDACEGAKVKVIGDYLRGEFTRAQATNKEIAKLFPSKTGGLTGCVSNWLGGANFPTAEQYLKMREYLNNKGGDYLRREYDYLRREYEDLRRPFNLDASMQWGDIWEFSLPTKRTGHPCEKPVPLMAHIARISTRKGDTILDPFMGSGTTLVAAKQLGRKAIGIELEEKYCEIAVQRLRQGVLAL